jgi:hypothetical protein
MDPEQIFQKTDKGREEISKRTHRVEAKRRTLLILVDGQSDAASLAEKVAHMGDAMAMLGSLWSEGFIEPVGEAPAAAPEAAPAATSVPGASAVPGTGAVPGTLEQLKRAACTQIERLMGPDGDALALKLEKTATREEFFAEARKARDALKAFLGPKKAEIFAKAIGLP